MLKAEDNEKLVRVGPGTPGGNLFRRYWLPALLSSELPENDGPPVRLRLLGEDLIAFRTTDGTVGIVDAFCPHRRAPMFFGRNEECGLRCVYHGWKFDVDGNCVDMPSEPPDSLFKSKVTIAAYPVWEGGDCIWTYMGPPELQPEPPDYEWVRAAKPSRFISKTFENSNYLHCLEGSVDTTHTSYLHNNRLGDRNWIRNRDGAPQIEVVKTGYGLFYVATRDVAEDGLYLRIAHYVMPAQQMRGSFIEMTGEPCKVPKFDGHIWVPIDDHHTYVYNWMCGADASVELEPDYCEEWESTFGRGKDDLLPGPGFHLKANPSNDHLIDRAVQKTKTFTGIRGINTQDFALQENMGIVDRSLEHLGSTDRAIIAMRQQLLDAVADVAAGETPKGADPSSYRDVRPADGYMPRDRDWREFFGPKMVALW